MAEEELVTSSVPSPTLTDHHKRKLEDLEAPAPESPAQSPSKAVSDPESSKNDAEEEENGCADELEPKRRRLEANVNGPDGLGCNGVCIMSTTWKDEQHPSFINFISCFLNENSCRLNFVSIDPDFIFNCGGVSAAFLFVTNWDSNDNASIFSRVQKLRGQFANLYLVVTLPTKDQNDSFVRSYFKYGMELGRPAFMPVKDLEMGFEKIVKVALARGACKKQDVTAKLRAEREISVQSMNLYIKVVTSIPGIDNHDANALNQAIGSIEAIAKASKEYIMDNTDLSAEKAELIARFFRDPKYYLGPKIK